MKKKFMSALLFGALLAAPASMFVSCKDYDDDISELRGDITTNATDLESLVTEKMKNLNAEVEALKSQSEVLKTAYEAADRNLEQAVKTATNDAKGYADIQAAEAQKAAIASAQTLVDNAVASLQASLVKANAIIESQGSSIESLLSDAKNMQSSIDKANALIEAQSKQVESLLAADKELQNGITDAKARADQAYALAEAASKQANAATDEAKEAKEEVAKVAENLKVAKEGLEKQIATFSESIDAVKASLAVNKANIEKQEAAIEDLKKSDENILSKLSQSEDALNKLIVANQSKIADLEKQLAAAKEDAQKALADAKAYTDDATKLVKEELTGVKSDVNGIQLDVEALKKIGVDYEAFKKLASDDIATVKATLEALSGVDSGVITKIQNDIANINSQMSSAISDLKKDILNLGNADAQLRSDLEAKIAAVQESIKNTDLKAVEDAYKDADSKLGERIDDLNTKIANATGSVTTINKSIIKINGELGALLSRLTNILTGMVFQPTFYYGGIQAMEATTFEYKKIGAPTGSTAENPSATGETYTTGSTAYFTPEYVVGHYHLNPSSYNAELLKGKLSAISFNCEYVPIGQTRSIENALEAKIADSESDANGVLAVKFDMNTSKIKTSTNMVSVIALQAKVNNDGKDTLVTSNYAALCKSTYKNLAIADKEVSDPSCRANNGTDKKLHIYKTAAAAINAAETHNLVYNDTKGINLTDLVIAHYTRNAETDEKLLSNVGEFGLMWKFDLAHYKSGTNNTSESVHGKIYEEDGITYIKACLPKSATEPSDEQSRATINRKPMVRVTLVDTKTGDICAIGYIKFKITEKDAPQPGKKEYSFVDPAGYSLSCTNYSRQLTWFDIESQILADLNVTKAEFETNFLPVEDASGNCTIYKWNGTAWVEDTAPLGEVKHITNAGAEQTNVLRWDVPALSIYNKLFANGAYNSNQTLSATVKFQNTRTSQEAYVTFEMGNLGTPAAEWTNENKLSIYWAQTNAANTGTGFDEIHNNAEVYGQDGAQDRFCTNILGTLVGGKLSPSVTSGTDAFKNNLEYDFFFKTINNKFKGNDGKEYVTSVSGDGQTLYAKIVGTTGAADVIARLTRHGDPANMNSFVEYEHSAAAHALLNYKDRNSLTNDVLKAVIGFKATNSCGMFLPIKNAEIPVRFIRPITAKEGKNRTFTDAVDGGNKLSVFGLVDFNDWRNDNSWKPEYYKYYGILSITPDMTQATTDMTGSWKNLKEVAPVTYDNFKYQPNSYTDKSAIATTAAALQNAYGTLVYENISSVTADFQVKVPLVITYDWGTITTHVTILVKATK